jgi:hypothetical protein
MSHAVIGRRLIGNAVIHIGGVNMKSTIIFITIILTFLSCSDSDIISPELEKEFKKIAYDSISESEKETITINWTDAIITHGYYDTGSCKNIFVSDNNEKMCFFFLTGTISLSNRKKLVAVSFKTINDPLLGPIIRILDYNRKETIGGVGRL